MVKVYQLGLKHPIQCFVCKREMSDNEEVMRIMREGHLLYVCVEQVTGYSYADSDDDESEVKVQTTKDLRCVKSYCKWTEKTGRQVMICEPRPQYLHNVKLKNVTTLKQIMGRDNEELESEESRGYTDCCCR